MAAAPSRRSASGSAFPPFKSSPCGIGSTEPTAACLRWVSWWAWAQGLRRRVPRVGVRADRAFTGYQDYSASGHAPFGWLPVVGPWFVLVAPIIGGLIYGPLIMRFASEAKGHGVPEVMASIARNGGRNRPRVAIVKTLASALCIGSGGSGTQGRSFQIASALGSSVGQLLRLPEKQLQLLRLHAALPAASRRRSTPPIAAVFFALELILRDFEVESFGVVVLSSVAADAVGRAAFGNSPFLVLPAFPQQSVWGYRSTSGLACPRPSLGSHSYTCCTVWRISPIAFGGGPSGSVRLRRHPAGCPPPACDA